MTTPTPAQIEAVRKVMVMSSCFGSEVCIIEPCKCAELVLTAAAGVGKLPADVMRDDGLCLVAQHDFTAAAEVGNAIAAREQLAALENVKAITIERCAQVAEGMVGYQAFSIAAAIRALTAAK